MYKLKILFVGPAGSGKTTIANFLADMPENIGVGAYRPTQGVRILEYETLVSGGSEAPTKTQIELWDCGSNQKYEMCWPALQNEAHGICFIIDAANPSHIPEVEKLFNILVIQTGLNRNRCMLIAHHKKSIDREMKHLSRLDYPYFRQSGSVLLPLNLDKLGSCVLGCQQFTVSISLQLLPKLLDGSLNVQAEGAGRTWTEEDIDRAISSVLRGDA